MESDDRRSLIRYCLIAYAVTWVLWAPALLVFSGAGETIPGLFGSVSAWQSLSPAQLTAAVAFQLAVYGPLVAAMVVLAGNRHEFGVWRRSLVAFNVAPGWYLFVFGAPVVLGAVVTLSALITGGEIDATRVPGLVSLVWLALSQMLTSGLEEPGWRGFALPLFQRSQSAENASWNLGLIWAGWHLPYVLYLYRDAAPWQVPLMLAGFVMSIVGMGYVHAWVRNSTGSVALNVLLHGWANAVNTVLALAVASPLVPLATAGVTWVFVAWLFKRYGKERLSVS